MIRLYYHYIAWKLYFRLYRQGNVITPWKFIFLSSVERDDELEKMKIFENFLQESHDPTFHIYHEYHRFLSRHYST